MKTKQNIAARFAIETRTPSEALQKLAAQFPTRTDRDGAAALVRAAGFEAYRGGRHVAVIPHKATGPLSNLPERLALITGAGPDWE